MIVMSRNKYSILIFGGLDTIAIDFIKSLVAGRHYYNWIILSQDFTYSLDYNKSIPQGLQNFFIINDYDYPQQIQLVKELNPDIILDLETNDNYQNNQFRENVLNKFANSKYVLLSSYLINSYNKIYTDKRLQHFFERETFTVRYFRNYAIYRFPEIIGNGFSTKFYDEIYAQQDLDKIYMEFNIKYPFIHEDDVLQILRYGLIRYEGVFDIQPYSYYQIQDLVDNTVVYTNNKPVKIQYRPSQEFKSFIRKDPRLAVQNVYKV